MWFELGDCSIMSHNPLCHTAPTKVINLKIITKDNKIIRLYYDCADSFYKTIEGK